MAHSVLDGSHHNWCQESERCLSNLALHIILVSLPKKYAGLDSKMYIMADDSAIPYITVVRQPGMLSCGNLYLLLISGVCIRVIGRTP